MLGLLTALSIFVSGLTSSPSVPVRSESPHEESAVPDFCIAGWLLHATVLSQSFTPLSTVEAVFQENWEAFLPQAWLATI